MSSILKEYNVRKGILVKEAMAGVMKPDRMMQLQELLYRINVLETCMCLCETAPVTENSKDTVYHYKLVDACFECMVKDRCIGEAANAERMQQRENARKNLEKVIQHSRRQFASFSPKSPKYYKECIVGTINNTIPIWMQYRNTYTRL